MSKFICFSIGIIFILFSFNIFAEDNQIIFKFISPGPSNIESLSYLNDANNDNKADIIAESYGMNTSDEMPNTFLLSGASRGGAEILWKIKPIGGMSDGGGYSEKCLERNIDIDNDGVEDFLLGTAWGGRSMHAFSGKSGDEIWNYSTVKDPYNTESGWIMDHAPVEDANGDKIPEVIVGVGQKNNTAYLLDGSNGNVLWRFTDTYDTITAVTAIGDVNDDNISDIAIGEGSNGKRLIVLDGASKMFGTVLWKAELKGAVYFLSSIKDINGNKAKEILVGDWYGNVTCFDGKTGLIIWEYFIDYYTMIMKLSFLKDTNNDGYDEVIISSSRNSVTVINGKSGKFLWEAYATEVNDGYIWSADQIKDLDKDGINDVIAASFDTKVYVFSGKDGKILFSKKLGDSRNLSIKSIPDINNSGFDDIAIGTQALHYGSQDGAGTVFVIEGNPAIYQDKKSSEHSKKLTSLKVLKIKQFLTEKKIDLRKAIQLLSGY